MPTAGEFFFKFYKENSYFSFFFLAVTRPQSFELNQELHQFWPSFVKKKQKTKKEKIENSSSDLSLSNTTQKSTSFEQQAKKKVGNFFSARIFFFSSSYDHFDFSGVLREGTAEGYPIAVPSFSTREKSKWP